MYAPYILIGILGLIVGSFLNVVIYRLPKNINLIASRSYCPKCKKQISWWQNIPIVSYVLLRGKCNHCKHIIHWRYPAIELLSCFITLLVAIYFGINAKTFAVLILTWSLIAAVFIDLDHLILPDSINLPLIWMGLLLNTNYAFTTPENAIIGAASGYLILWVIARIFKLIRKIDGMGYGDFKLLAVFGAWLGWQILPLILFTASLIGSIVGLTIVMLKKNKLTNPIPFGPYLAITGWLAFFFNPQIF